MSRTILNPEYANDLNGLFDGTGIVVAGTLTANSGVVQLGTTGGNPITLSNLGTTVGLQVSSSIVSTGQITANSGVVQIGTTGGNPILVSNIGGNILEFDSSIQVEGGITSVGQITANNGIVQIGSTSGNPITVSNLGSNILGVNSTVQVAALSIVAGSGGGSGTLSVNSSNQLLWNGVVIS